MKAIHAIYENGVFRPLGHVSLAEQTEVEIVPRPTSQNANAQEHQDRVYDILSQSFDTEESDLAERHNEHQP